MAKKTGKKGIDPKLKKFVTHCFRKYAWNIGVSNFKGDIHYMSEDEDKSLDRAVQRGGALASMTTDRRYLGATLRIYPSLIREWEEGKKNFVAEVIAHEVGHLATQHLYECATSTYVEEGEMRDAWETLTEIIGRMAHKIAELEEKKSAVLLAKRNILRKKRPLLKISARPTAAVH